MKLLASDYDGTLSFHHKDIDVDTKRKIKEFQEAGNLFVVVTGRSFPTIKDAVQKQGISPDYIVSNNGGFVWDANYNNIRAHHIDSRVIASLLKLLVKQPIKHIVMNTGRDRYHLQSDRLEAPVFGNSTALTIEEASKLESYGQIVLGGVAAEDSDAIQKQLHDQYGIYIEGFQNVNCIDIVPRGIDKAKGVEQIIERIDIDRNDIYTIGDSYNDLPMLKEFHGATLDSASEDIRKQITSSYASVGAYIDWILTKEG